MKGGNKMIERTSVTIDSNKSQDFIRFLKSIAKDKKYWQDVKKGASKKVDKKEIDKLVRHGI